MSKYKKPNSMNKKNKNKKKNFSISNQYYFTSSYYGLIKSPSPEDIHKIAYKVFGTSHYFVVTDL